jgi:hypothetical protein
VTALGKDVVHELLVRTAYQFQKGVASIEAELVTGLCNALAVRKLSFDLPNSARQVALTIGADEIYHAYVAREFIADVKHHTGVDPDFSDEGEPPAFKAMSLVRKTAPVEFLGEAETMALCFAENFVTDTLFDMWKGVDENNPFRIVLYEHLIDEGRHQKFFQNLMRHMWNGIDGEARVALGGLLPGFLDAFLLDTGHFDESSVTLLGFCGFDRTKALEIIEETYAAEDGARESGKYAKKHVSQCRNLIQISGMLDHAPTREALIRSGWAAT